MSEHVALPVAIPDLTGLTDEQLSALRNKVSSMSRDYRRKANTGIGKQSSLRKSWNRLLGMNAATPKGEREEIMRAFERDILPYPDLYLMHALANSLVVLDAACREEGLRRKG